MLYDLLTDPEELVDLGDDPAFEAERARLKDALFAWSLRDHNRITVSDARMGQFSEVAQLKTGIVIGFWDQAELDVAKAG